MQLGPTESDERFRAEVRGFLADALPEDLRRRTRRNYHPRRDDVVRWTRILAEKGWSAPHWPVEYGGTDWSPLHRVIFEEEMRAAHAPTGDRIGTELVAPVLYTFGSEAHRREYLPGIRNADILWAQGFSEPNAGSDLSSLRTRAVRDGNEYVVNGQKMWTTEGHHADLIFTLVRTDPDVKPQQGISALIIDMKAPGVVCRPIWTMDEGLTVNEVFFDDVRVPMENLVGEGGAGWTYAKFLLTNERATSAEAPHTRSDVARLRALAARPLRHGKPLLSDPDFRDRLANIEIDLLALEYAVLRVVTAQTGDSPVASLLKVRGSELRQRVADLAVDALGLHGLAVLPDPEAEHRLVDQDHLADLPEDVVGISACAMFRRATTIYGGANEIQRTLIAKTILGL